MPENASCGVPAVKPSVTLSQRIVGGVEARAHSFPWQCSIRYKYSSPAWAQFCGASVLSDRHVVTAAHCVLVVHHQSIVDSGLHPPPGAEFS